MGKKHGSGSLFHYLPLFSNYKKKRNVETSLIKNVSYFECDI